MKKIAYYFPKFLFLAFGGLVVMLSLLSTNKLLSQGEGLELAKQTLYFEKDLSPDHVLYPAAMVADRARLFFADPDRLVELKQEYAWQRMYHTEKLLDKGYQKLSFSTITKSYKYYNEALLAVQQLSLNSSQAEIFLLNSQSYREQAQSLFLSFSEQEQQEIIRLTEQQIFLEQFLIDSL